MIPGLAPAEEIKDPAARRYCEQLTEILSIMLGRAGNPEDWFTKRGELNDIKLLRMGGLNNEVIFNPNATPVVPVTVALALPLVDLFDNSGELIVDNDGDTVQYEV